VLICCSVLLSILVNVVALPSRPAAEPPASDESTPIVVQRKAPTTHYANFINKRAPVTPEHEDAFCRSLFNCIVRVKYTIEKQERRGDEWLVTARLQRVTVTLVLDDTIFLPEPATAKLRAHEEGHRRINEMVYGGDAESAARDAAASVLPRTWQGRGPTLDAAGKAATDAAVDALGRQYLARVADRAYAIGSTYDDLTDHGRKLSLNEDEAIRLAFAKHAGPATAPAARRASVR
jgi:hypothetical protein